MSEGTLVTEATPRHDAGEIPDQGEPRREATPGGSAIVDEYLRRTPGSAALQKRSKASMPGGASRAVGHWLPYPVAFDRGEGADLIDVDLLDPDTFGGGEDREPWADVARERAAGAL